MNIFLVLDVDLYGYSVGDADVVGIPKTNTWYFDGYDTDECFDRYFANPTDHRPPTVYLGFPCTKVITELLIISYTDSMAVTIAIDRRLDAPTMG